MAYVKNWLHCVWGTKNRIHFLSGDLKYDVINHILENCKSKGIYVDILNGVSEHLHCLISLNPDQALSNVIQLIKGESSYWINKNSLTKYKFEWAQEYYGVSVSESHVMNVRRYIKTQEKHHRITTWQEESDEFMKRYGFNRYII